MDYAKYVLLVAPVMTANYTMNHCLRAEGSALFSMLGISVSGILNCILDPIFIFILNLGVAGASMATAFSKMVSFCILLSQYLRHRSILRLSVRSILFQKSILLQIAGIGSTSMFRSGLAVLSGIVLNNIAGGISDSMLAGIGVANKIMLFPFSVILGFCNGFQAVAGYNWGAKQYDRVTAGYRFASVTAIAGAVVMALFLGTFPGKPSGFSLKPIRKCSI